MITKDMRISKILRTFPETTEVFYDYDLDCLSCMQAKFESLEQAAELHGFDINEMLFALNEKIGCAADLT